MVYYATRAKEDRSAIEAFPKKLMVELA